MDVKAALYIVIRGEASARIFFSVQSMRVPYIRHVRKCKVVKAGVIVR